MRTVQPQNDPVAVWGGPEYTFNRVGHSYFDQMGTCPAMPNVLADLEAFSALGIQRLRCGFALGASCPQARLAVGRFLSCCYEGGWSQDPSPD